MPVKICFNNQTHRIAQHPADFKSLLQKIVEIFGNQLPQSWTLQYLDSDDDKIMLSSQEDYKALLEEEIGSSSKSVKIFIETLDENQINADLSSMVEPQIKENIVAEKPVAVLEDVGSTFIIEAKEDLVKNEKVSQPEVQAQEEKIIIESIIKEKLRVDAEVQPEPESESEKKKKEFRDAVLAILREQLPIIASFTKDFIQEKKPVAESESQPEAPKEENTSVHTVVRCDGCDVFPIVGIRYKCHTCRDFDYCEKCEATKDHPHPFIKLKKPVAEAPQYVRGKGPFYGRIFPPLDSLDLVYKPQPQPQPEVEAQLEEVVVEKVEEVLIEEAKPEPEEIKKEEEVVIEDVKPEPEQINKEEVIIEEVKAEPEEIKKEEEVVEEKKEYDAKVVEKAGKLKEVFADLDLENVMEFISQVPDMSLEELVECYKQF